MAGSSENCPYLKPLIIRLSGGSVSWRMFLAYVMIFETTVSSEWRLSNEIDSRSSD